MWPFSWFKKKDEPEDYERVLADLALSISSKQTRLSEIRLRERRATLVVTLYAIGGWIVYLGLWWTVLPRVQLWRYHSQDDRMIQTVLKAIPALVGPMLILFVRRIVQRWYAHKADSEEKQLKALMAEQRIKIEEIKKKTNYYSTKNLLDRYDDSPARKANGPSTPNGNVLRQRQIAGSGNTPGASPASLHPSTAGPRTGALSLTATPAGQRGLPSSTSQQLLHPSPQPMAPSQRHWYDKVADALLGDDEASATAMHSRYALVCENCFSHNGLVRESEWDDMKYVCPKCGYFNASPRMKREHPEDFQSRAPSLAPSQYTARARRDLSSSPPLPSPLSPRFQGSVPNSAEPFRSRFPESSLSAVREASPSPRGRSTGRRDEDEGPNTSVEEQDESQRDGSPMKVD